MLSELLVVASAQLTNFRTRMSRSNSTIRISEKAWCAVVHLLGRFWNAHGVILARSLGGGPHLEDTQIGHLV
jgi:hypothetical protein